MPNKTIAHASFVAAVILAVTSPLRAEQKIPDDCKTGGFFIGCQAYTFNHYTVFEAIEKTAAAGGRVIEFFPDQKFSRDEEGARKIFEFAKTMGLHGVTTESVDAIDTIEKMVKEYDIKVGFHDHPKRPDTPNYR